MAAKVQLDIESKANTQALKQAIADLEKLGMAGKSTNQVFGQTNNLEGYKAALVKSYETARTFGDQMKATRTAFLDTNKAIKAAQAYLGENKNNMFTFIDEKGMQQQTRDMALIEKQIRGFLGNVVADTQNFQKSMTRKLGEFEGFDSFKDKLQTTADAYKLMGNELGGVQYKMTAIQQQVLDMTAVQADPAEIQKLATEYKKLTKEHEELAKAQNGTSTRIKNLIKNFVSAQLIVWALRKAFQMLTQGIKEASDAAAAAEQVYNKFDTVFDGLENKAAQVADTIATQYGMAGSSAREAMASIADMFVGMGVDQEEALSRAEQLTSRLSDIMAFKDIGGTIVENAQSIMSGIAGNTENFRKYGSIVKESAIQTELLKRGLSDLTGQQLEAAKATVRMDLFLKSQKNSIGATAREWDNMASVQRRYDEQRKELKEHMGESINTFFKPLKEWLSDIITGWNDAYNARQNYLDGTYSPTPTESFWGSQREKTARKDAKASYQIDMSAYVGSMGSKFAEGLLVIDYDELIDKAKQYGATATDTAKILSEAGYSLAEGVSEQAKAFDDATATAERQKAASEASLSSAKGFGSAVTSFQQGLSALTGGGFGIGGLNAFIGQDASSFSSLFDQILGVNDKSGNLEKKKKAIESIIEYANNTIKSSSDATIKSLAQSVLEIAGQAYSDVAYDIGKISRDEKMIDFSQQIDDLNERNRLLGIWGDENSEIVDLLMQQKSAEREINEFLQQQVDQGLLPANELDNKKLEFAKKIAELYGIQLGLVKDTTAEQFAKNYQDRVDALKKTYESLKLTQDLEKQYGSERAAIEQKHIEALQEEWRYMSEQVKLGMDATEANEMYLDSAKLITAEYELQLEILEKQNAEKLKGAFDAAREKIGDVDYQRSLIGKTGKERSDIEIQHEVEALSTILSTAIVEFATTNEEANAMFAAMMQITSEYREKLELQAAEEAHQAVMDSITSAWEGTGDVGMISGWVTAFAEGGPMAGIAKVATDLLTRFESVNDLLSIVTKFIEYVSPAVDQFLAPLMPVLEMILSTIADLLLPVLQILFPVIQGLSVVLIYLHAVVKTVTNAFSWLVDTIVTAIWNIAHPFRQRAFRDLGDETVAIWEDANAKVEKIWNMELDTRLEFVGKLTDAQQGQLDAYNEMFKAGLLTLSEYNAMVGKNVYGRNFDNVDIASFASGGNFITNGEQIIRVGEAGREHVQITPLNSTGYANRNVQQVGGNSYSVVVNGANGDPEEIAMAVRQEFKRMERRGVRYA